MHLVHESGLEILPYRGNAAADANVPAVRGFRRAFQRVMDSVGHEMECGAAVHCD